MLAAGQLNQQEEDNIRIYIYKFERLHRIFKNDNDEEITIAMFLNGVKKGIKNHAISLKN